MPVFHISTPVSPADHRLLVDAAVSRIDRRLRLADGSWLVAVRNSAVGLSNELGITGSGNETGPITQYPTLIIQVATYAGRGYPEWWEWIKTNWEATSGG